MSGASSSSVLDYGRAPPARWRRLVRWTVVALLLVALAFAGLFAMRSLAVRLARREGYAKVTAWYQQARTSVVPAGTLLYSEAAADLSGPFAQTYTFGGRRATTAQFGTTQPTLRMIAYRRDGVPITYDDNVLYVHEHPLWAASGPPRPNLFCVSYRGLDAQSRPQFFSTAYELVDPTGRIRFPFMGSVTSVQTPVTRSLANLRIFAGAPDPADATKFSLPFTCDGGSGRFCFQTDVDVADGGQLAPSVTMTWDDAAATQPGARDAVSR